MNAGAPFHTKGGDCYLCAKCPPVYVLTTRPARNLLGLCADCTAWWRASEDGPALTESVRLLARDRP